ncbi:peptidylprolyl isomerase [Mesorhizobium sp. NBSH29]|uniref:SurA N-terminal domain-containing protein n=1 Tax=Mesorhizobium sp. NBSH29 TaxID=2654249 RepID=UPI0018969A9F|nr:SurA N-terminal domain-containing protein [Mesorhizobium sp. NBSH29]QPC87324.1 peptidylprolyl isomerase [Mesorhizobium sp. NBSH29]
MNVIRTRLISIGLGLLVGIAALPLAASVPAQATEIKYVINNEPITSYDIQRRAAFIKLQRSKGSASEQMIEQTLHNQEVKRLGIRIPDKQVDEAYNRFATGNKLQPKQLDGILDQAGVTKRHFKEFIRAQMSWSQALNQRARGGGKRMTEQEAVRKMLQQGGSKPSATEYMLQQVIFVVPANEKGSAGRRKQEADAMRQRFKGCDTTRQFAKGLVDVTVRDLGRVLAPELPSEWADAIKATSAGSATPAKQTERGFEFIGVCSSREVSDDRVAQLVLNGEALGDQKADEVSKTYTEELRKKARIVER